MKKLVILPLLLLSLISSATNYYVKRTGSDAANGLSDATAWATPAKVTSSMSLFQPGDSILFKKGDTWTNALITIGKAGIAGKNIIISSYGSGARPVLSAQAGMPVIYITAAGRGYWTVDDLDIRATTPPGGQAQSQGIYFAYWLSDLGAVPGWEIKYCKFNCSVHVSGPSTWIHHNTFAGDYNHSGYNKGGAIIVRGPEGDNCIIENNTIYGWVDRAIWIMRGGSNPVIRFNTAYDIWGTSQTDHAGTGINIDGYGVAISGAKVYNNYVYNCTGLGLSLENAFGAEAYNNRFINCGWGGFSIYWYPEHQGEPSNVNIHHNIVRNGAWGVLVNVASHWTIAHNVFIKDDTGGATSDKNALYVNSPSTYISNGTFANNIIAGTGYVHPVKLPDSKNIWTLFDYNIIVPVGTEIVNRGGTPLTLSQVQAMGYMAHGSTA
ncbi:MAG TPA: right-handed parallel beta-helix repeat-containing protein, partial [Bacteroidales bacterium]|nr:right-handed parallel beta-helix repeat-containing protein [Bacteroidales bacterium]